MIFRSAGRQDWDTVRDERGMVRRVPMASDSPGNEREKKLARARSVLHGSARGRGQRVFQTIAMGIVAGTGMGIVSYQMLFPGQMDWAITLAVVAGVVFGGGMYYQPDARPRVEEAERLIRECRLCLTCGYDLAESKPEDDGCVVCPECGAAWRMEQGKSG